MQDADDWWDGADEADAGRGPASGEDDAADASDSDALEPSDDGAEEEPEDDERYRDMLAAATGRPRSADAGPAGRRKRRHDVLVSEAYPESEYNLSAQAATAGVH